MYKANHAQNYVQGQPCTKLCTRPTMHKTMYKANHAQNYVQGGYFHKVMKIMP